MMSCWQNEPEARPAFTVLTKQLRKMENQHKVRFNINIKSKSNIGTYAASFNVTDVRELKHRRS